MSPPILDELRVAAIEIVGAACTVGRRAGSAVAEHLVETADVPDAVLAVAEQVDADLIVAGRRGLGALGRLFLGSVSEPLLHRSTRPLLLVHGDAACWPPETVVAAVDGSGEADRAAVLGAAVAAATGAGVELLHPSHATPKGSSTSMPTPTAAPSPRRPGACSARWCRPGGARPAEARQGGGDALRFAAYE